jgi:ribonucleotide reductase alpha subunit
MQSQNGIILEVQKVIQKHTDNAVSKTVNMPNDYPIEKMSEVWLEYLPVLKGTTFFREQARGFVNKEGKIEEPPLKEISVDRAKELFNINSKREVRSLECPKGICDLK